jgi:hypothetical protein
MQGVLQMAESRNQKNENVVLYLQVIRYGSRSEYVYVIIECNAYIVVKCLSFNSALATIDTVI